MLANVLAFGAVLSPARLRPFPPAGTRYRKRGLSDSGHVANEVETEQIVEAGKDHKTGRPLRASVVQLRGR